MMISMRIDIKSCFSPMLYHIANVQDNLTAHHELLIPCALGKLSKNRAASLLLRSS